MRKLQGGGVALLDVTLASVNKIKQTSKLNRTQMHSGSNLQVIYPTTAGLEICSPT